MTSILFSGYFSPPYVSQRVSAYADKAAAMAKIEMFPQICEPCFQNQEKENVLKGPKNKAFSRLAEK